MLCDKRCVGLTPLSEMAREFPLLNRRQSEIRTYIWCATLRRCVDRAAEMERRKATRGARIEMSAETGTPYQSYSTRQSGEAQWCAPGEPWKLVEIVAMVLGFIVFWPIGLAVLGWKFWQRKSGYPGDIVSFGREKWGNRANWASGRWGFAANHWPGFAAGATGNRAFDEWRATEIARLEEERKRLAAAEREFADYLENLRHAKDREEFEHFMNQRRDRQGR
jgi:hypothetical protein